MSRQGLSSVCGLARAWWSLLGVLPVGLNGVLFVLGVLPADLGESLRSGILLVLKADGELPRVISFVLSVSVVGLYPCLYLVFLAWYIASWFEWGLVCAWCFASRSEVSKLTVSRQGL